MIAIVIFMAILYLYRAFLLDSVVRGVKMARQSGHTGSMALNPRPFSTRGSPSSSKNPKSDRLLEERDVCL